MRVLLLVVLCLLGCERAHKETPPPPPPPKDAALPAATDLMLVLDLSKSMEEMDLPPDRLDAMRGAVRRFVQAGIRDRDRFGIVIFAQKPLVLQPLVHDADLLDAALAKLQIGDVPALGTAIGDALALAVDELRPSTSRRVVVLLADGDNNWVTRHDPKQATALAKAANVTIYSFMIGSEDPSPFGGMAVNPVDLEHMAKETSGTFYRASDVASIERGLREIRAKLDGSTSADPWK